MLLKCCSITFECMCSLSIRLPHSVPNFPINHQHDENVGNDKTRRRRVRVSRMLPLSHYPALPRPLRSLGEGESFRGRHRDEYERALLDPNLLDNVDDSPLKALFVSSLTRIAHQLDDLVDRVSALEAPPRQAPARQAPVREPAREPAPEPAREAAPARQPATESEAAEVVTAMPPSPPAQEETTTTVDDQPRGDAIARPARPRTRKSTRKRPRNNNEEDTKEDD